MFGRVTRNRAAVSERKIGTAKKKVVKKILGTRLTFRGAADPLATPLRHN